MERPPDPPRRARGRPRAWTDRRAQNTIKSLDRAIETLEHLSVNQGRPLSDLASGLGQSPATVYRTLVTLEGRGFVEFDPDAQTWWMGARAFVIGARFLRRTSIVERARPILRDLMEATGETANLGLLRRGEILIVGQVETHTPIRAFFPPGTVAPLHASAIGKALLAQMPPEQRRGALASPLPCFTERTLADHDTLDADLAAVAARGYAIDAEERNVGMICLAAPVFDLYGNSTAGVSISGPVPRMRPEAIDRHAAAVMDAARALTEAIGGM